MSDSRKLVIIGTGETAELAYEYFTHDSDYDVAAFAVDAEYRKIDTLYDLPVVDLGSLTDTYPAASHDAFVAIASAQLNYPRARMIDKIRAMGYRCASYVSSRAFVWHNVKIGENCFILEDNTLQPFTEVEDNVTLWSGNHIGHRSIIRKNCFITSHVVVSGFCDVGEHSFIGVNAALADKVSIGRDNFIGMGAIVNKSTEENGLYVGNPAERKDIPARKFCKVKEA